MSSVAAAPAARVHGIDRRTVGPSLLVMALAVLMSVAFPMLDSKATYRHQLQPGDVIRVAGGITLVPASGWALASGALVGHARTPVGNTATTQLVDGGVSVYLQAAPFTGSPAALLARVNRIDTDLDRARGRPVATTGRYPVTTHQGLVGMAEDFVGVSRQGTIVAFVFTLPSSAASQGRPAREGVEVAASGPPGPVSQRRSAIVAMIRSLRVQRERA